MRQPFFSTIEIEYGGGRIVVVVVVVVDLFDDNDEMAELYERAIRLLLL